MLLLSLNLAILQVSGNNKQALMILVFFIIVAPVLHHLGCRVLKHGMRMGLPNKLMGCPVGAQFYPWTKLNEPLMGSPNGSHILAHLGSNWGPHANSCSLDRFVHILNLRLS